MEFSEYDYVLIKNGQPLESLDVIYYFSSIIEMFNMGFKLEEGEEFVCMTDLPSELKNQYIKTLSYEN